MTVWQAILGASIGLYVALLIVWGAGEDVWPP